MTEIDPKHIIWIVGTLSCGSCCFVIVLIAAYFIFFRKRPGGGMGSPPAPLMPPTARLTDEHRMVVPSAPALGRVAQYGNLVSNVTDEGFFLYNQFLSPGSMVHYRFRSDRGWVTRSIPYQPGPDGTFVYLGHPPRDLQVVDVVPVGGAADAADDPHRTMMMNSPNFIDPGETVVGPNPNLSEAPPQGFTLPQSLINTRPDFPAAY